MELDKVIHEWAKRSYPKSIMDGITAKHTALMMAKLMPEFHYWVLGYNDERPDGKFTNDKDGKAYYIYELVTIFLTEKLK